MRRSHGSTLRAAEKMRSENGNAGPVTEIDGHELAGSMDPNAGGNSAPQEIATQTSSVDSFYEKLSKLFESSGLSLLFNFRETSLDLHVFYKEVTERGGFHLVTKDGKWGEVASTLNSKSIVSMSPIQLQKLYAHFLYQFEQSYHYRTPAKVPAASGHPSGFRDSSNCSTEKRKHCDISHNLVVDLGKEDGPTAKKKCSNNSNQMSKGPKSAVEKVLVQASPKNKDIKKDPNAPSRSRSAYQIFLRMECERLKKIHGQTSGSQNIRDMAIDAWRTLSQIDRQPYVEESRKDKERFNREMAAYKARKNCTVPWLADGTDYHVTVHSAPENFFIKDESSVEIAGRLMKNEQPNDTLFQISNWDDYCGSLGMPG